MTYLQPPSADTPRRPEPWAVWPTFGISVLILLAFFITGAVLTFFYLAIEFAQNPALADPLAQQKFILGIQKNGNLIAWSSLASGFAGLGAIGLAIKLKKGWKFKDYLNFQVPKWHSFLIWNVLLIVTILIEEQIAKFFAKESDFLKEAFASEQSHPVWLFLAIVIMAPLFEEFMFRGFMFKGMEKSWLGVLGTVLVTSFIWAIIHVQYDLFFMGIIFTLGLLLGYARHVTKSIWIPTSMHALNNAFAMASLAGWIHIGIFC